MCVYKCVHSHSCFIFLINSFICMPQNLQWARDVLLGSSVPWQQLKHMPAQGLFCERNKTNLFNVSHFTMFDMVLLPLHIAIQTV